MQVESVAATLCLAEQCHAAELKRICLGFAAQNRQAVRATDGYQHMMRSWWWVVFQSSAHIFCDA